MSQAIFLDRDGVINPLVFNSELGLIDSPLNPTEFKLIPGAGEAIRRFNRLGLKVIVVSNQPGIAKGKMSEELFEGIRQKMKNLLAAKGAFVDGEYYCLHHPDAQRVELKVKCSCRKPQPGLLLKAAKELGVLTPKSYMIGDGLTDIKAGQAVGCKTILIGAVKCDLCRLMEKMAVKPDIISPSLLEASQIVEKQMSNSVNFKVIGKEIVKEEFV
jgi:D-glycero-D-manno-heptose 1,7-bisphosphate phosphatase